MRSVVIGLGLGLFLSSCAGDDGIPSTYLARDSAGIALIENTGATWGDRPAWTVGEEPSIKLGVVEGSDSYRFYRLVAATRLMDGTLLVADAGSGQLRLFGSAGDHLATFGTQGDGPGEFRSIRSLGILGDTVLVFDDQLARVTVYRVSGDLVSTWSVGMARGGLAMGDLRFSETGGVFGIDAYTMAAGSPPALVRDTALIFELHDGSPAPEPIASVPGSWTEYMTFGGRPLFRPQPLTNQPTWDERGGRLYVTSGDAFEFRVFAPGHGLERVVRRMRPAPAVTPADAQSWRDRMLERVPEAQRAMLSPMLEASTMPAFLPVYASLIVDSGGNTWLGRFTSPGETPPSDWDVYAADGAFLGTVRVPPGLQVFEIGLDYVLGKWTDELDVEYLVMHPLDRSGAD